MVATLCMAMVVGGWSCGGDGDDGDGSDDQTAIEETIAALDAAVAARDYDAWAAHATEKGIGEVLIDAEDRSPEGLRAAWHEATFGDRIGTSAIELDGDEASVTGTFLLNFDGQEPGTQMVFAGENAFLKVDGEWKLDGAKAVPPPIPEGTNVVHVNMSEFAFELEASDFDDGGLAIELENIGDQPHQLDLRRIPADLDIDAWLADSEADATGIVGIGGTRPLAPGETTNVVFDRPLPPGRYLMLCFIPDAADPDEVPHFEKGMRAEFAVR